MNVLTHFGCSTLQPEEGNSVPVLIPWPAYICSQHFVSQWMNLDLYTSVLLFLLFFALLYLCTLIVQNIGVIILILFIYFFIYYYYYYFFERHGYFYSDTM